MSTRERAKAAERALKNAKVLCSRQRRNMKAYVKVIHAARAALEANDPLRALALLSGNIKYPAGLLEDMDECPHLNTYLGRAEFCKDCKEVLTQ